MRTDRRRGAIGSLPLAMLLGRAFLGLKLLEYREHLAEGFAPGVYFTAAGGPGMRMYFTLYYVMTGLHALHVIAGLTVLGWLMVRIARRRTSAAHHTELELGGLYWHLVDVVWIFLWPLLYLT